MSKIKVKLNVKGHNVDLWAKQTKGSSSEWENCIFFFDTETRDYDWLVSIDDVSRRKDLPPERLACPDQNTILVTTEPATITRYSEPFTSQFEYVITSQEPSALPHRNRIYSHTGNRWFHGRSYNELVQIEPPKKTKAISTLCSAKQQKYTIHQQRYEFTQKLKTQLPELDIFGRGVREIANKYDALDGYKMHLAIENHVGLHHWTEKLADPFLSYCLPIYYGCPNAADYFPAESFIEIDLADPNTAIDQIKELQPRPNLYEERLDAIIESRRRVLEDYNLIAMLDAFITEKHRGAGKASNRVLHSRKTIRLRNPVEMFGHINWSLRRHLQRR